MAGDCGGGAVARRGRPDLSPWCPRLPPSPLGAPFGLRGWGVVVAVLGTVRTRRWGRGPLTGIGFLLVSTGTNPRSTFGLSSTLFLLCSFGGLFLADSWFLWRSHHLRPGVDAQDA